MRKIPSYITTFWNMSLLLVAVMTILGSCAEYESILNPEDVPEGMPASVTLTVQLPNMMSINRAAGITPDDDEAQHVSDLWIGFYNANSTGEHAGERAGIHYDRYDQVLKETGNSNKDHITIENIKSLSGEYYIVAVANPSLNKGLNVNGGGEKSMLDLLNDADTWDKYKNLAVLLNGGPLSIQYSGAGLPMTGIYYANHNKPDYQNCIGEDDNPTPVAINPGDNALSGCIQLRHVDAYVKFNIQVDNPYKDLISLTPVSWQIFNLPGVSYVHERKGECNAADTEVENLPDSYKEATYHNSPLFEGAMTFPMSKDGVASFDFYQMENKHIGIADEVNTYNDREKEFKNEDDTNTGWYKSLVGEPGEIPAKPSYTERLSNNNASYVVIKAHLEYYYQEGDKDYKPVLENTEGAILRVADAIYTIHLGYCEGNDESSKAIDFNCRRNTKYTYNVYISGADQIRVEAMSEGMTNGVEGTVTDVMGDVIKLDAHYGTFNIQLSDKDRMDLAWRIQAPFGDETIKLMYDKNIQNSTSGGINLVDNEERYRALNKNQFYNWIQFRPTTNEDVLADYPGDPRLKDRNIDGYYTANIPDAAGGGVWYLNELKDVITYPHTEATVEGYKGYLEKYKSGNNTPEEDQQYEVEFTKKRWYTVFVDEYVYEYDYKENNPSLTDDAVMDVKKAWGNFVNKDSRHVWLALSKFYPSTDAESFYANSAYIISQESIQTYYTGTGNNGQALGIEAINESYNENYRKEDGSYYIFGKNNNKVDTSKSDANDGMAAENLPSYNGYTDSNGRKNMKEYVTSIVKDDWNSIWINKATSPRKNNSKLYYIPNHEETFMAACMGRNRDLNNNGTIDVNEIRWYLPTTANYIQIILGAVSLRNPLFNFAEYEMNDIKAGEGTDISHFATSNNQMVWAEELAATGKLYAWGPASNFRCIRNLGQEMSNISDEIIAPAYNHNPDTRTVVLEYYDLSGLRDYASGHIIAHSVDDIRSFPSRKFQYAKSDCAEKNTGLTGYFDSSNKISTTSIRNDVGNKRDYSKWREILNENTICGAYSEEEGGKDKGTWRTPNISELAIINLVNGANSSNASKLNKSPYISSSYEYFDNRKDQGNYELKYHWFMGVNDKGEITADVNASFYLRCVRDVE